MNDCIYPLRPSGQPPDWMEGVLLFLKEWRTAVMVYFAVMPFGCPFHAPEEYRKGSERAEAKGEWRSALTVPLGDIVRTSKGQKYMQIKSPGKTNADLKETRSILI